MNWGSTLHHHCALLQRHYPAAWASVPSPTSDYRGFRFLEEPSIEP